jgi:hypothetical protein
MSGGIYLVQADGRLIRLEEQPYATEDLLQGLLADYPDLLAGEQVDSESPRRWLLVQRETGVPDTESGSNRWSLDHLFLDQDGVPTLVEVKRSTDTRIRREVVGQMLDYAANAVAYWPGESIRAGFEARIAQSDRSPDECLQEWLGPDGDPEEFWQKVRTNLQMGRVRLMFVADEIPPELRRVVEFLNQQMDATEVLAVEVRQFVGEGLSTLVPRVIGQTVAAREKKTGIRHSRQWDEPTFFEELEKRFGQDQAQVAREIKKWSKDKLPRETWGKGAKMGSFVPVLDYHGTPHWIISLWTTGSIELNFQYMKEKPPFDSEALRLEWLRRVNEIPGVAIPEDGITRRPTISYAVLTNRAALDEFFDAMNWAIGQIKG